MSRADQHSADVVRSELTLSTADGVRLAATRFEPPAGAAPPRRTVVVAPALAVPRRFYQRFAAWLAAEGYRALTFDYRGIGGSRPPGSLRTFDGTLTDWGRHDLPAALSWASAQDSGAPCALVGHSVAGQLLPLLPDVGAFDTAVLVAATSGDYRLWPLPYRLVLALHFEGLLRALPPLVGHYPGRLLGGEAVPPGVAREWSRWARTPGYLLAVRPELRASAERVRARMLFFSVADDHMGTPRAVDVLAAWFRNAPVERRHVAPRDAGVSALGHFGFFKAGSERLWQQCVGFIDAPAA